MAFDVSHDASNALLAICFPQVLDSPPPSLPRGRRNPNFLGEFMCWLGLAVVATAHLIDVTPPYVVAAVWASPALTLSIMLGEAVLLSEWKNNKRFSEDAAFVKYRRRTSLFFPVPPAVYKQMPRVARMLCCFEWPVFDANLGAAYAQMSSDDYQHD